MLCGSNCNSWNIYLSRLQGISTGRETGTGKETAGGGDKRRQ